MKQQGQENSCRGARDVKIIGFSIVKFDKPYVAYFECVDYNDKEGTQVLQFDCKRYRSIFFKVKQIVSKYMKIIFYTAFECDIIHHQHVT